ncbi:MAG: DUF4129 domain-containing protein [Bacteroidetes bacterium]|nr:DUF4129 domain-containing protein [Bacteroidota bacterium]MBU1717749.1 DUF4129 domain-containing protein [Bacteroidota bacterium]
MPKAFNLILILSLVLLVIPARSWGGADYSRRGQTLRIPPKEVLERYANDSDFVYKEEKEADTLGDRIKRWFNELLSKFFSNEGAALFIRYIIIILVAALVIFQLIGMSPVKLFARNRKIRDVSWSASDDDPYSRDFRKLAAQHAESGEFRLAVRYYFLHTLKILDEQQFIEWNPNKANRDYVREASKHDECQRFGGITLLYEKVWYGNHSAGTTEYRILFDFGETVRKNYKH